MKWQQYTLASMPYRGKSSGYISMPIFMPFLPSTLSANAKKHKNVVNKWTDGQKRIPISINKLRVSRLDTSACQNDDVFVQEICPQYQNPSPWTVERRDECIKSKQYPSALMFAESKISEYISMPNCMSFPPSDLSANVQKPEKSGEWTNGRTDGGTNEWPEGISMPPTLNLEQE